jgi:PAS domain S-box-containing protein
MASQLGVTHPPCSPRDAQPQKPYGLAARTQEIEAEQTRLLYAQAPTGFIVTLLNAGIVTVVLWHEIAPPVLVSWFALMVVVTLARFLLVQRYRRAAPPADQVCRWRTRFIIGASGAGLAWGAAAIFLFPQNSLVHQLFLAFVLGGMITGAVALLSWVKGAFLAFLLPAALPITVRFFTQGSDVFEAMGVTCLIFSGALWTIARHHQASVAESLALRFANLELIRDLSASERQAIAASVALQEELLVRRRMEEALRIARDDLEARVQERTAELSASNIALQAEVSAREQAEKALQHERDLLAVTLASISDAVIATDAATALTFLNPVAETLTGWPAREASGRYITEIFRIIDEQTRQVVENPIDKALREGRAVRVANHTVLVARDGKEIPVANGGAPIRDKHGHVQGAVMVFHDITERKQAEAALIRAKEMAEAADRTKSEFLATISHELRTPLYAVIGYADLLAEGEFGPVTAAQSTPLERIRRNAQELCDLITAVLDLSRLAAGRLPVIVTEVQVPTLLEELKRETQELGERAGLQVLWKGEPTLGPLHTDGEKLKLILKNLLGNALKFTPAGSVTVATQSHREGVEISITDTGIGIPADALAVIFEPFRQGDGAATRPYGGAGLGLSIVKRLVELLGGTVAVESEVGQGSTFRVWLPTNRPPPPF